MKKLYIIRHSKAVEYAEDHSDFNRCLAEYGVEKAGVISKNLAIDLPPVDLIISSPACRALETAKIFSNALGYDPEQIVTDHSLYHFGGTDPALNTIAAVDDKVKTLMLFGHNPTFSNLAWQLCHEFREGMPTSAVVGIELDLNSWSEIFTANGHKLCFLTMKNLRQ